MRALWEKTQPRHLVALALLVMLALLPPFVTWIDEPFYIDLFSRVLIHAIAALSLNLILGYGGMVSFGHATYLGVGGYVVGIGVHHAFEDGVEWLGWGWVQFPVAMLLSAVVALIFGAISLRTKGIYFIMITLAFAQMLFFTAVGLERYGADDGLSLYGTSDFSGWLDLGHEPTLYYLGFVALLVVLFLKHRVTHSRFGRVLAGGHSNDRRMQAIGFPTYPYRLTAFVLAGMVGGLAGALMANHDEFVSPSMMHWIKSGDLIIMVVLGGMGTLFGPLYGAVAFLFLEEALSAITEYWQLIFGPLLVLVALFARGGINALMDSLADKLRRAPAPEDAPPEPAPATTAPATIAAAAPATTAPPGGAPLLHIEGLVKQFGGLLATDHLSLDIMPGEIHAVIGPNGAGKTTLIGQISGEIKPDAGRMRFRGRDMAGVPVHRRSHMGLARSFQITNIFGQFSALDNVSLAVQAHAGHSFRFWGRARDEEGLRLPAMEALRQVGLQDRANVLAANLAHGEQRQLEIAMALATRPTLLLLDEPMAGMGPEESARMVEILLALKTTHTLLLIEHDMDAVFALADRITVLEYGRAIATGTPEEIRNNAEVRSAYLGDMELGEGGGA